VAFFVGPAFLGILGFKSLAKHIFDALIAAAEKTLLD
jgi:hypothetical protein